MAITFAERLARIRAHMQERGLDRLIAIHDGRISSKANP